eukprot:3604269-Pyramimonas_sp.AAC.1
MRVGLLKGHGRGALLACLSLREGGGQASKSGGRDELPLSGRGTSDSDGQNAVSYTHLTLPTILLV